MGLALRKSGWVGWIGFWGEHNKNEKASASESLTGYGEEKVRRHHDSRAAIISSESATRSQ